MTPQPSEQPPIDVEQFWRDRCQACAHPKHPLDECSEIVSGTFEPDYCPCAVELPYMAAVLRRLAAHGFADEIATEYARLAATKEGT